MIIQISHCETIYVHEILTQLVTTPVTAQIRTFNSVANSCISGSQISSCSISILWCMLVQICGRRRHTCHPSTTAQRLEKLRRRPLPLRPLVILSDAALSACFSVYVFWGSSQFTCPLTASIIAHAYIIQNFMLLESQQNTSLLSVPLHDSPFTESHTRTLCIAIITPYSLYLNGLPICGA